MRTPSLNTTTNCPNIVGPYGVLKPFTDVIKLFIKEPLGTPLQLLFIMAPTLSLTPAFTLGITISISHS